MNRLSLDHSKPSNWNSDTLILRDVDMKRMWSTGCVEVEAMLQNVSKFNTDSFDFVSLSRSTKITLLKPFGKIGLKTLNNATDWSIAASVENRTDDESEGNDTSSIIDFVAEPSYQGTIIDYQVLIEGKYFYKASVIRQVLNTSSLSASKDRLRRVRGVSKYADDKSADIDVEDMILLGDPLIFIVGSSVKLGSVNDIQRWKENKVYSWLRTAR